MSEQNEKEGAVGSLERGLLIIRVLLDAPGPMSLAELAQELALGPSTVHRLLGTPDKAFGRLYGSLEASVIWPPPSPGITKFPAPNPHPGAAGVSIGNRRAA